MITLELTPEEAKLLISTLPELKVVGTLKTLPTVLQTMATILDKLSKGLESEQGSNV